MNKETILMLVGPDYEDLEVWYPKLRLEAAGFEVPVAGMGEKSYLGKHGYPCPVDGHVREFMSATLAGIIAPGGWAPDKLRRDPTVLNLVREVHANGGLVATICHGPWILISAGIVKGRRMTSTVGWPEYKGRDGCRTPMPWEEGEAPNGFSTGKPWLPVKQPHSVLNVASQEASPDSLLAYYRLLLSWRKAHDALVDGDIAFFKTAEPVLAYRRSAEAGNVVCVFNLSPNALTVTLDGLAEGIVLEPVSQAASIKRNKLSLGPNGFAYLAEPAGQGAIVVKFNGHRKSSTAIVGA